LVFAGLDYFTKVKLFYSSKDFRYFSSYPARAETLRKSPGLKIALVGNSITDRGVDPELLGQELSRQLNYPVHVEKFVADGSQVNTWYYIIKRYLWSSPNRPDYIFINYWGESLTNDDPREIGRLARFFTTRQDWPELMTSDLTNNSQRL